MNERKPCFVDSSGTPCAVAHLMQESGADGQFLAGAIVSSHKHDTIGKIFQDNDLSNHIKLWTERVGLRPSELALIQPTYEFVAASCRIMFSSNLSEIKSAMESSTALTNSEIHELARKIVIFGDELVSGFGYPLDDIPNYLAELDGLTIPDHREDILALVSIFQKEVDGAGWGKTRTQPKDYLGLLSEEDLNHWKQSNISNERVKH
eukprot:CAMPEP_0194147716 /NCGR_PEP_ID=MMETSP0152-20130528/27262_1 /TAXON_ID=1049557 /ORGANISM="Thalassiothrix antarctica, Strain L6-D1" /LENGTH=206 /DNA_ID=CAMNT_0038848731 /DNA_START=216 /DNA_END=836 /DNA_ORIENTATION=-